MKKFIPFMLAIAIGLSTITMPVFADYSTNDSKSKTDSTVKNDDKSKSDKSEKKDAKEKLPLSAETLACIQTAVDTRDTAIMTTFDTYYASVKTALDTRKTALKAAWALSTSKDRKNAISKAWQDYKSAAKTAKDVLKKDRKTAWEKFKTDFKACKGVSDPELNSDSNSEGADILL